MALVGAQGLPVELAEAGSVPRTSEIPDPPSGGPPREREACASVPVGERWGVRTRIGHALAVDVID